MGRDNLARLLDCSSRPRHRCVTGTTATRRPVDDRVTLPKCIIAKAHVNGETMESLVIQISMWHDDDTIRARVWSDVEGRSTVRAAATRDEVLALVDTEIQRWTSRFTDEAPR